MSETFDPILSESDKKPIIQPGTVIVIFDGTEVRLLGDEPRHVYQKPVPEALPSSGQSVLNTTNPLVLKLSAFGKKAVHLGARVASTGAKQAVQALKQTDFGARFLGSGERYFLVYVGKRTGEIAFEADSASNGIPFSMTISFEARVINAAEAVVQGVRDLCGHHLNAIRARAREVALRFLATDLEAVRKEVNEAFATGLSDGAIEVSGISVRITLDQQAVHLLRAVSEENLRINAINAQSRTERVQRGNELQDLTSPDKVLAAWLSTKDDRYRQVYEGMIASKAQSRDEKITLLRLAIDKGLIEPHDIWTRFPDFADSLLTVVRGATPALASSAPSDDEQ